MDPIEKARELAALLRDDPRCLRLQAAHAANDLDAELQQCITAFSSSKEALSKALSGDTIDREASRNLESEMRAQYTQLMNTPSMQEYAQARREVDELLAHIDGILKAAVSGTEEPESAANGCAPGGCTGCKGCGAN